MGTCTYVNVACTSNFNSCTNNTAGELTAAQATGATILGATTTYTSPVTSSYQKIDDANINTVHANVMAEVTRRRQVNTYTDSSLATENVTIAGFNTIMNKIQTNLAKLGYNLGVAQYDKLNKSTIDTIYTDLNASGTNCACVTRCACNSRDASCLNRCSAVDATWGAWDNNCTCNVRDSHMASCYADTTACTCNVRCPCDSRATS